MWKSTTIQSFEKVTHTIFNIKVQTISLFKLLIFFVSSIECIHFFDHIAMEVERAKKITKDIWKVLRRFECISSFPLAWTSTHFCSKSSRQLPAAVQRRHSCGVTSVLQYSPGVKVSRWYLNRLTRLVLFDQTGRFSRRFLARNPNLSHLKKRFSNLIWKWRCISR